MGDRSAIEWTDATWNPIVGCSIVSPGCTNCYAMKEAYRFGFNPALERYHGLTKLVNDKPVWTGKLNQAPDSTLLAPLKRNKPTTYFVNSMSDLFHEGCPDAWIDRVFAVMALSPQHTFQVLTKRAKRMRDYCSTIQKDGRWLQMEDIAQQLGYEPRGAHDHGFDWISHKQFLPNVWLGVSAERQQEWDDRKQHLRDTPAAIHFASFEPLLSRIVEPRPMSDFLQWAIVGGESGPGARPMHPEWARSLRDQCRAGGVPFFFKQWGEWAPSTPEQAAGNPRSGWCSTKAHPRVLKAEELYPEAGAAFIEHLGKKRAGRMLDGKLYSEFPTKGAGNGV